MMDKAVLPLVQQIHQASQEYIRDQVVQPLDFEGYPNYLENGNRLVFENQYFARRRQLAVLGLDYLLSPDEATKQMLERTIWEVCNEYTWALPAHLPVTGTTFGNASPRWLDLFAAETGETLAEIQSLVGESLSPMINQRIDLELNQRILAPLLDRDWSWQHKANNWSAVIAGAIGLTVMFKLPKDSPQLTAILSRLDIAFATYLGSFGDDGACVEGVSYWAYGFGYYLYFAEQAATVLGQQKYLDNPKVKQIAAFPYLTMINQTDYLPFSDYALSGLPSGLLCYCHQRFAVAVPAVKIVSDLDFDTCYRFAQLYRNLIWTKQIEQTQQNKAVLRYYFSDVQWLINRDQQADFVFAAKGGSNQESHNHLDLGHFILGTEWQLFLTDLGAGEYTKDYFNDDKRYQYFVTSAASHSIPIINGQPQPAMATKIQANYRDAESQLTYDLISAYPAAAKLTLFNRRFEFAASKRLVILEDQFAFQAADNEIVENFVTTIKPQINGNQVWLTNAKESCQLTITGAQQLQVLPVDFLNHDGQLARAYQIQARYKAQKNSEIKIIMQLLNN
ncbi:MAG: heparinase II/III-family protein [Lactobacillaceae bacterium]|jgi:hypothetical protein|nr:heparinase II/III-family protein [Lactobacillaceae bacterium]